MSVWRKIYSRVNWQNKPSRTTPLGQSNLNIMDKGIDDLDDRVVELHTGTESLIQTVSGLEDNIAKSFKLSKLYDESTNNFSIDYYGFGAVDTNLYPANASNVNKYYLNLINGAVLVCIQQGADIYTWRDIDTRCIPIVKQIAKSLIKLWDVGSYTIDYASFGHPKGMYISSELGNNVSVLDVISGKLYKNFQMGQSSWTWAELTTLTLKTDVLDAKIDSRTSKVYGFHINDSESNPSSKVTYLADAVGMTPAYMNYTTGQFNYGSWQDAFFMPRPCILSQTGQVMKYLNPNDFTKDVDGNTVAIDGGLVGANVMIEFPKIWYKVVPDSDNSYSGSVYISSVKVDEGYKDYAYIDYQGNHKEHFYMPAYNGSLVNNVMRSISGQTVNKSKTGQQEIDYCTANGNGWYTEDAGEIMLINFLLILMGKSTDTQTVFGQGLHTNGTETINNGFTTGIHNDKGMFYGTNSGTIASGSYGNAVKIFGMENYWGFQWRRYAGNMLVSGVRKIKLCYGNEDGSTSFAFNGTGDGYVNVGQTPSGTSGGYISKMKFTHDGMYSAVSSGSSSTYYCDGQWYNNSATCYALRGGDSYYGSLVGAFSVALSGAFASAWWNVGAAPSYK